MGRALLVLVLLVVVVSAQNVVFVWHMHQPPYYIPKGSVPTDTGKAVVEAPWVRLWTAKAYYPMLLLVEETGVKVTFDITPTLLEQIEMYAQGRLTDKYLQVSLKKAEGLTEEEKSFILERFFDISWEVQIPKFPRYQCLLEKRNNAPGAFDTDDYRDLQVLFNLAWINEKLLNEDPVLRPIYQKAKGSDCGTHFTDQEKMAVLAKHLQYPKAFLDKLAQLYKKGQIEVIMTPYYYPIAPLVENTNNALSTDPGIITLPKPFAHPEDVSAQVQLSRHKFKTFFKTELLGIWPPELAVDDQFIQILAQSGIKYTVADQVALERHLGRQPTQEELYTPWERYGVLIFFRDRELSDWIGFTGSTTSRQYGERYAAEQFLSLLAGKAQGGFVVIALDGENPWEWYPNDGYVFLTEVYKTVKSSTKTLREAASSATPRRLESPLPTSSWAGGSLSVWIGEWEENLAWRILEEARQAAKNKAWQQLLYPAEAGDWFWWYGRDRESPREEIFDSLFREIVKKFYEKTGLTYNYTWPLDEPIHYRTAYAVDWAGAPFRRLIFSEVEKINITAEVFSQSANTAQPGKAPGIRVIAHWGPVAYWGGPWGDLYFAPMTYVGDAGNNDLYILTPKLAPGRYEFTFIAQGSNEVFATAFGQNYQVEVLPRTEGRVCGVELKRVEIYDGGHLLAVYTGNALAYVGNIVKAYYEVCGEGPIYVATSMALIRQGSGAPWDEVFVLASPTAEGLYVAEFRVNYSGVFELRAKAMGGNVYYSTPAYIRVEGGPGPRVVDGREDDWVGQPPLQTPGAAVSMYELIVTDPRDDQYRFYRPDWSWPPTDDLDAVELRLYSDGQNLYGLVKLKQLTNIYAPYVMIAIGVPGGGFSEWLPDWSDTRLAFKWDYIIGINYGKGPPLFLFDHDWSPRPIGQIARSGNIIEFAIPLDQLPLLKTAAEIYITAVVFANNYGGVWDPGKNNAYDPVNGRYITENDYASNVYDVFGQAPTSAEVYGGWNGGDYTVDSYVRVVLDNGRIVAAT